MTQPGTRILVVEDNPDQIEVIREMLDESDEREASVEAAERLSAAVAAIERRAPDVVLLDLNLPDSSGLDGVERLHAISPDVPLIVLTNVQDERLAMEAASAGAHDYLLKREMEPSRLARSIRYARERARGARALREREERFSLAADGTNDGIWDWFPDEDRAWFSPRWCALAGVDDPGAQPRIDLWLDRVHPEDVEALRFALDAHLTGKSEHLEHEHRILGSNGEYLWVLCRGLAVRDERGHARRVAGSFTDITQRKRAEQQLLHDALHDALTRLPNRTLFLDRLEQALRRSQREGESTFAVMFLDLDRFKTVNDSLGHAVGDELLVSMAARLQRFLRPGDTFARLGGDEFAILMSDVEGADEVRLVAQRMNEQLSKPFVVRGHEIAASASIGVALANADYESPEELLRDADIAMYRAKLDPSSGYRIFDGSMRDNLVARDRLEADLRQAIEAGEFVAHYQPIVAVDSGRVRGFEALVRWRHPGWGLVHPDQFLQVAEETGLVVPIGWWILEEAARQTREWQRLFAVDPPLTVSVNVSGRLLAEDGVVAGIAEILERTGLEPGTLHIDITESAVLDRGRDALAICDELRALGVRLDVDDFGTGYASLTSLQRFCYDSLKIDRSFVHSMFEREESNTIVRAILALGESLGIKVIAEGVETQEQLQRLRDLRCAEAQGFSISHPMAPDATGEYLARALDAC